MHIMWRQKGTNVKSVSPPLATGVLRRPHACWPLLQVRVEDPITETDSIGLEPALLDSPLDGALAGLEEFHPLNQGEQTSQEAHNRSDPSRRELSVLRLTRLIVEADGVNLVCHDRLRPCIRVGIDGLEGLQGITRDLADQPMHPATTL
jgi:hypothetical protein